MNPQNIQIEIAQSNDYQHIADIYNEYILLGTATMQDTLYDAQKIKSWVDNFNDRERLFALKANEKVIGWAIIKKYSDREGYRFTCETSTYLTQTELGKGYGSILQQFVVDQCKALNYHHIVAKIWASNQGSIDFHKRFGYTEVGIQKAIGFKNGQWTDVMIMQCIIDNSIETVSD